MANWTSKFRQIMKYLKETENTKVTVDVVIFTIEGAVLKILLVKRGLEPFKGAWALPGGVVKKGENLAEAAARELKEETGVYGAYLEQLYTFGAPSRDPRGRVITVAYFALMHRKKFKIEASSDASEANLFSVSSLPKLAFDHEDILEYALMRIRNKIQYTNAVWSILPENFTLGEIQNVYEIIWGRKTDKRNFRKKILSLGLLKPAGKMKKGFRQRPAKLYAFKTKKYVELKRFF